MSMVGSSKISAILLHNGLKKVYLHPFSWEPCDASTGPLSDVDIIHYSIMCTWVSIVSYQWLSLIPNPNDRDTIVLMDNLIPNLMAK